jgi:hypothetical protein
MVQNKRGVANTTITWNNTVTFGTVLQDGAGGNMTISVTPTRRCWWLVHGQTLWAQVEAVWMSFEVWLFLQPADLNYYNTFRTQHSMHSAVSWQSVSLDGLWTLEANTTYYCSLVWGYSSGYNQTYHCHPVYHYIEGELIGEGAL